MHSKEYLAPKSVPPVAASTTSSPSSPQSALPTEVPAASSTTTSALPKLHAREATIKLADLERLSASGALRECFGSGTAATICPIGRIGVVRRRGDGAEKEEVIEDIVLPEYEGGLGPVAGAMYRALVGVYEGRVDVDAWSVAC